MSTKSKKLLGSIILVVSSLMLLLLTEDRFVRLFILTAIIMGLIYTRKWNVRKIEKERRRQEIIKDLEKEEADEYNENKEV